MRRRNREWLKRSAVFVVGSSRQRPQRPAVIAALRSNDFWLSSRRTGKLQRRFDRFRSGVAKKRALHALWRNRPDLRQQLGALIVVKTLVTGGQRRELIGQRGGELRIGMTKHRHT